MPISDPLSLSYIVRLAKMLRPKSVLDIGCGLGHIGYLMRTQLEPENWPAGKSKPQWSVRMDALEIFPDYLNEVHQFIYNRVIVGDIRNILPGLETYDLMILGNILEHFEKEEGRRLVEALRARCNLCLILTTPVGYTEQGQIHGNEAECHRSGWLPHDFRSFGNTLVLYAQMGHHPPSLAAVVYARRETYDKVRRPFSPVKMFLRSVIYGGLGAGMAARAHLLKKRFRPRGTESDCEA
jgi:hypothetical protein